MMNVIVSHDGTIKGNPFVGGRDAPKRGMGKKENIPDDKRMLMGDDCIISTENDDGNSHW